MKDKESNQYSRYGLKGLLSHICFCSFLSIGVFCGWSSYLWYHKAYKDSSYYLLHQKNQAMYMITARHAWIEPYLLQGEKQAQNVEDIIVKKIDSNLNQLQHKYPSIFKNPKSFFADFYSKPLGQWLTLLISSIELSFWKLMILISPMLLYGFSWLLGLLEGLLEREIRIAEGGRESSWFFHQATRWMYQFLSMVLLVYFLVPFVWPPFPWIVTICIFCFVIGKVNTMYLKKYL